MLYALCDPFLLFTIMTLKACIKHPERYECIFISMYEEHHIIRQVYEAKEDHERSINSIAKNFQIIFSKYGVEKYDAFDDVGGKLSFALAMLDKDNTGLILDAVHSRDNCFLYLKEIVKGESYVMLSQEEVEALRKAVNYGLELEEGDEESRHKRKREDK